MPPVAAAAAESSQNPSWRWNFALRLLVLLHYWSLAVSLFTVFLYLIAARDGFTDDNLFLLLDILRYSAFSALAAALASALVLSLALVLRRRPAMLSLLGLLLTLPLSGVLVYAASVLHLVLSGLEFPL